MLFTLIIKIMKKKPKKKETWIIRYGLNKKVTKTVLVIDIISDSNVKNWGMWKFVCKVEKETKTTEVVGECFICEVKEESQIIGQDLKVNSIFIDRKLNKKIKVSKSKNLNCLDCVYNRCFSCNSKNSPECRFSLRKDKEQVVFLEL